MKKEATLIRARLKTPRAAAIAGILFAVLLITSLVLFRLLVRADPLESGPWLTSPLFGKALYHPHQTDLSFAQTIHDAESRLVSQPKRPKNRPRRQMELVQRIQKESPCPRIRHKPRDPLSILAPKRWTEG